MPREADPGLEVRILEAARTLWRKGGERALTMRRVAKAAGTTTPTLYQRFQDRDAILRALRLRAQQNLFAWLGPSRSPAESCQRYLEFARENPSEYDLLSHGLDSGAWQNEPKPSFELMKRVLAARLGGTPGEHATLALALWSLLHGTAELLVARKADAQLCGQLKRACLAAFEMLVSRPSARPASGRKQLRTRPRR